MYRNDTALDNKFSNKVNLLENQLTADFSLLEQEISSNATAILNLLNADVTSLNSSISILAENAKLAVYSENPTYASAYVIYDNHVLINDSHIPNAYTDGSVTYFIAFSNPIFTVSPIVTLALDSPGNPTAVALEVYAEQVTAAGFTLRVKTSGNSPVPCTKNYSVHILAFGN